MAKRLSLQEVSQWARRAIALDVLGDCQWPPRRCLARRPPPRPAKHSAADYLFAYSVLGGRLFHAQRLGLLR